MFLPRRRRMFVLQVERIANLGGTHAKKLDATIPKRNLRTSPTVKSRVDSSATRLADKDNRVRVASLRRKEILMPVANSRSYRAVIIRFALTQSCSVHHRQG